MKKSYSRRSLLEVVSGAVCSQSVCYSTASSAGAQRGTLLPDVAYRSRVAFYRFVDVSPRIVTLGEELEEINNKGKVSLLATDNWSETSLALCLGRVPVAIVMDAVATSFGGSWHQIDRQWVLAHHKRDALKLVNRETSSEERRHPKLRLTRQFGKKLNVFASAISPHQWRALEAGEKLSPRDLSPIQWQSLRSSIADIAQAWSGTPHALHPSALQGNVIITMEKRAPGWTTLRLQMPQMDGVQDGAPEGVLNLESTGHDQWRPISQERLFDLIEAARAEQGDPDALTQDRIADLQKSGFGNDYRKDARFEHKVIVSNTDGGEAVIRCICKHPSASLMMQGEWLRKPIGITLRDEPAWKVMDSLATLTNSKWKPVGAVWVLAPEKKKTAITTRTKPVKSE